MRTTYPVCYDITDDNRLRRVFKGCKNYGDHLQCSVFECDLSVAERVHQSLVKFSDQAPVFTGRAGAAFRLTFAEPVRGPLALGFGAHFGLGLFVPQEH